MKAFNVYLIGVGGQGIGLLSEVLLRAADAAGHKVKAVDTHGLAQRGGVVVSNLRMGPGVHSPIIPEGEADLLVALERHEALRGMNNALKDKGTLIYYNTVWQPLDVRLGRAEETREDTIGQACKNRGIREFKVFDPQLKDARMQNMAVLGTIHKHQLVPGIAGDHYRKAMEDLLDGEILKRNLKLFEEVSHGKA
jgi:indolepyruvate ferredoxin oxidoreductase beta subunit